MNLLSAAMYGNSAAGEPASAKFGMLWFDTSTRVTKAFDGERWVSAEDFKARFPQHAHLLGAADLTAETKKT
jgi:hypothetical protein